MENLLRHDPQLSNLSPELRSQILEYVQKTQRLAFLTDELLTSTTAAGLPDPEDTRQEMLTLARWVQRV